MEQRRLTTKQRLIAITLIVGGGLFINTQIPADASEIGVSAQCARSGQVPSPKSLFIPPPPPPPASADTTTEGGSARTPGKGPSVSCRFDGDLSGVTEDTADGSSGVPSLPTACELLERLPSDGSRCLPGPMSV